MKIFIYITLCSFILFGCDSTSDDKILSKDSKTNQTNKQTEPKLNWRHPALFPVGASIGNYLRAYYLVGQFDKMLPFLIIPECMDREEVIYKLRRMNWGYDIKMTNIQWEKDSSFVMTYKTTMNNTTAIEQYVGCIQNDTAKLYIDAKNEQLFVNNLDFPSPDDCSLKQSLGLLQFEFDSDVLLTESASVLKQIGKYFERNPSQVIAVIGHTSSEGSAKHNQELSEARAKVIYDYLRSLPIDLTVSSYMGRGDKYPIYSNVTEEGRAKNRRVEIRFLKN